MGLVSIKPAALVAALVICAGIGGAAGWVANGWRLVKKIESANVAKEKLRADQAHEALADLAVAAHNIRAAADSNNVDVSALGVKLDAIKKDIKNAKNLPVDCRPDDVRVRVLESAIGAANKAITGQ